MPRAALNKKQIKIRLVDEGRWAGFLQVRETARSQGHQGDECWLIALEHSDQFGKFADALPYGLNVAGITSSQPNGSVPRPMPSGMVGTPKINLPKPPAQVPPEERPTAATFKARQKGDYRGAVEWVAENLHLDNVVPEDAPSGMAWALLLDCRALPRVREMYWSNIFPRLLPSEKEISQQKRSTSENLDTRDAIEVIKQAEEIRRREQEEADSIVEAPQPEQEDDEPY